FSLQKSRYPQGSWGPVTSLATAKYLQDHHEVHEEAQELLSYWIKSKLQLELSDGEEEVDSLLREEPSAAPPKHENFDDLCSYLECEMESSSVQKYLQHLLQSDVVNRGIAKQLRLEEIKEKKKFTDPRIIMELRHKQVKENRMRHQKALELQRQEESLKKAILSAARLRAQEEDRKKALQAKKEEEEIQREMVKLRKDMTEKKHAMAKGKRQEKNEKLSVQEVSVTVSPSLVLKSEEQGEEKQRKTQELLRRIHTSEQRCLQRHFSAWLKVILEQRIKMGKARALADWRCQLKALRAWRNYTWAQKVEQETQQWEFHLQDQNRKTQLAVEHDQRRLLRCCFLAWQHWSRAETEKRELQIRREQTKKKMEQLLEAVLLGKGGDRPLEVNKPGTAKVNHHQDLQQDKVNPCHVVSPVGISVLLENTYFMQSEIKSTLCQSKASFPGNQTASVLQQFQAPGPKTSPAYGSCFEHRHAFQQRVIEEQRQQLQKQQELILKLQENQKLSRDKEEAAQATALTQTFNNSVSQTKEEKQSRCKNTTPLRYMPSIKQCQLGINNAFVLQKELEKQRRLEKEQQLLKKAREHYEKVLLRKLGIVPWKRLRQQAKENLVVAQRHHNLGLQRKCLMIWLQNAQQSLREKMSQAEDLYSHILLRWGFRNWLKVGLASTVHTVCLIRKYFWVWSNHVMEEKRALEKKLKIATEHSNNLIYHVDCCRDYF
uniref:Coiled-coil domain containing 191 n=1 Tax=Malurus cyaneus samueli TaxID=2593467 RepID=A0A8C5X252_9PASS